MINLPLYEDWQALNEIGEGSRPFAWKRTGFNKVDTWMADLSQVDRVEKVFK